jgi:Na+/H+-dicarboxylate symporter
MYEVGEVIQIVAVAIIFGLALVPLFEMQSDSN